MDTYLVEMLVCPVCHGQLVWKTETQVDDKIEAGQANCSQCGAIYPIQEGIGIFLTPDLPRKDLWAQVDDHLTRHLNDHPDQNRQLMERPIESLSPTDQKFRALALEEAGDLEAAREADQLSNQNLYTAEYLACWDQQITYVLDQVAGLEHPIVDLASGRGYLVEKLAAEGNRLVVATDFSLQVLRRNRKYFQHIGLADRISLLAFDARLTPFKDGAVKLMTTNLGLPNIESPEGLIAELFRVVGGLFLAVTHFFPPDDEAHRDLLKSAGLEQMLFRNEALQTFRKLDWKVQLENSCRGPALPTPESKILAGARADGLPLSPTELEWGILKAEK